MRHAGTILFFFIILSLAATGGAVLGYKLGYNQATLELADQREPVLPWLEDDPGRLPWEDENYHGSDPNEHLDDVDWELTVDEANRQLQDAAERK